MKIYTILDRSDINYGIDTVESENYKVGDFDVRK